MNTALMNKEKLPALKNSKSGPSVLQIPEFKNTVQEYKRALVLQIFHYHQFCDLIE